VHRVGAVAGCHAELNIVLQRVTRAQKLPIVPRGKTVFLVSCVSEKQPGCALVSSLS